MRELDYILGAFIDTDYSIRCLLQVMAALEEYYNVEEDKEQKNTLFILKRMLDSMEEDLQQSIERLDTYIMNSR